MKKHFKFLSVAGLMGVLAGGLVIANANRHGETKVAEATEYESSITMNADFFGESWTNDAGEFKDKGATFWAPTNYSFEALGTFYTGEAAGDWKGTLTSRTWKQKTQYIYFQLGGARDYDHADPVHLVFHYGSYSDTFYNNTFVENPMVLRYFKIPDDKFAELTATEDDFDMYVEIVDNCLGDGYGLASFGYLHVNQTVEEVSDAMRFYLNNLSDDTREWEVNKRKEIFNHYLNNASLREVFLRTVSSVDEDFESNSVFLNHWYFDHNYTNNNNGGQSRHFDCVISNDSLREEGTYMPYNKTGNGLFKGWWDRGTGFIASDALIYRFVSRPFVLSGSGLVSVKMAGRSASLHVIDTATQSVLGWADVRTYNGDGNQYKIAESGFNSVTMVRHVINLEAYVGRTIQLAIADVYDSGWAASYFDELVTNVDPLNGFRVEYTTQVADGTSYPVYLDKYVTSKNGDGFVYDGGNDINKANDNEILNHVDNSAAKEAYALVESFYNYVRGGNHGTNDICSKLTTEETKAIVNAYAGASVDAKKIFCASDDFVRNGSSDWYRNLPEIFGKNHTYNIARTIKYLGEVNNIDVTVYASGANRNIFSIESESTTVAIILVGIGIAATFALAFLFSKKRKRIAE